jgi:hypothetical protein
MDIYFLQYKFNSFFLPLLIEDSNERNKNFHKLNTNDIYDLIYLSSGICGIYIRNNSLKLLNKYIIYIEQLHINIISHKFLKDIYHFLINYHFENKDYITILNEINHQINIFINLENFTYYINNDKEVINALNNLCK